METVVLDIDTSRSQIVDLTDDVAGVCRDRGVGLCHVFAPHATAGLALIETGSGTETDLLATLDRIMPRDATYRHQHGSPGHGADHVLPAIVAPSLVIPVAEGRLLLGTWQSIVLVDRNADNTRRQVRISFLAG